MIHDFPWTDMHELNLDWFLAEFKKLVEEWNQVQGEWTSLHDFVQNFFDNLNVQTEIDNKINAMILDGTFADIVSPFVTAALPTLVAGQLPDVVAAQISAVVAAQISAVVADQLPAVAASAAAAAVGEWLAAHIDPDTGYVIDDTLTVSNAAADAKVVGVKFTNDEDILSRLLEPYNIFNTDNATSGKYIDQDGTLSNHADYTVSDYFSIINGNTYIYPVYVSALGVAVAYRMHFYESDDTEHIVVGTYDADSKTIRGEAPSDCVKMRVTFKTNEASSFMILRSNTYPADYLESNKTIIKDDVIFRNVTSDSMKNLTKASLHNLFDPADPDIVLRKYVSYDGTLHDNNELKVSGFIPVEPGKTYIYPTYKNFFGTSSDLQYASCWNADKTYFGSLRGTMVDLGIFLYVTIPANASYKYIRVNVGMADANSNYILTPYHSASCFMVIDDDSMPDSFIPYGNNYILDDDIKTTWDYKNNPLLAGRVEFLGDSICEGDALGGWAKRIGDRYEMLWENKGIGGSTIAITDANKTICTRAITMVNPDYIILEGGTNDADRIGNATGEVKPAAFGTWDPDDYGTNDPDTNYGFDINTFCGACDYMFRRFTSDYVGSKIGFIAAQKMGTTDSTRKNRGYYINTAMQIARKWGVPCLDLWNECYLLPVNPAHYTSGQDYMYVDGQHLTAHGYDYITPIISEWMKTL